MAKKRDTRVITPIEKSLLDRIDDYRFRARLPSRAAAVRKLLEAALAALNPESSAEEK